MGRLYLVATPIGNLEDLTRRAERVLGEVHHVAAEDTRRTGLLLQHLGIRADMVSLHAHNEAARVGRILEWLEAGEDVALVTDAGTPLVSDPGARIVRAAGDAGHTVVPIPGPSAVLAALVGSGMSGDRFVFLGFVPRKGRDRASTLDRIAGSAETCVVFESPERLVNLLDALEERLPADRLVAVGRELTKVHEEFVRGTAGELAAYYTAHPPKGEVSLVIEAAPSTDPVAEPGLVADRARTLLHEGYRPSQVAKELARTLGVSRNRAYEVVQELKGEVK
ncbi:MAG: 16S rRNA (cytidine(1402)-2'-O)-methyltransferase [Gemmatimonadota bacterium]|jgi:16S rRNA (cytidine1402-2'-O)-methyltransferase